jgi:poly-gamma-glutamate synthesis protein (capsule biosynthesis protein)
MLSRQRFFPLFASCLLVGSTGCKQQVKHVSEADLLAINESDPDYAQRLNDSPAVRPAVPFDAGLEYIDIRGVGDSAWSNLKATTPPASGMAAVLRSFDPTGKILKGDLNFINWESSVGTRCNSYYGVDYAFLSSPQAILDAYQHGFNLFGMANNHSEDCSSAIDIDGQKTSGAIASQKQMKALSSQKSMLWHGVGPAGGALSSPAVLKFGVKGRQVKVAFGSVAFQSWDCVDSTCEARIQALLTALKSTQADLKILSLHSQGSEAFNRGKKWAERFVRDYSGDIVFAHGPHTWAGVKVLPRPDGRSGVVFHGLGNFMHNQVAPNPDNLIGRVLLDSKTLQPKQVQVIPVLNNAVGVDVVLAPASKGLPKANLEWTRAALPAHKPVPVGFANIK